MADESYETTEEYIKNYEILLDLVRRREEMHKLLKIAQPVNIPKVQKAIANIDEGIERTEEIMELEREIFLKEQKLEKDYEELEEMMNLIEPELRKHVAEHNPEKLELLDAMLSDDDKTH